jgi:hypothetical protein
LICEERRHLTSTPQWKKKIRELVHLHFQTVQLMVRQLAFVFPFFN